MSVKKSCALCGLVALWAWFDIHLRCYCCCFRVGGRGESIVFQKIHIHAFPMLSNKHQLTTPGSICMGGLEWVRTQVLGNCRGGVGRPCSLKARTQPSNCLLSSPHPAGLLLLLPTSHLFNKYMPSYVSTSIVSFLQCSQLN